MDILRSCWFAIVLILAPSGVLVRLSFAADAEKPKPATMVVEGRIWTGDSHRPFVEAIAVSDDKIVAIGSREELAPYRGKDTKVFDAGAGMVVPGLIDSHIHLVDGGLQLSGVQLRDAKT